MTHTLRYCAHREEPNGPLCGIACRTESGFCEKHGPPLEPLERPWRTGSKNPRVVYSVRGHVGGGGMLGVMDSPELAALVVAAVNAYKPTPAGSADRWPMQCRAHASCPDCRSQERAMVHTLMCGLLEVRAGALVAKPVERKP